MHIPGRDARGQQFVISKAQTMVKTVSCAFFVTKLNTINSTLRRKGALFAVALLLVPLSVLLTVFNFQSPVATAATSNQLNFQGRLLTNTGALVADGVYNMQFDLYYVSTGGTSQWTEDRLATNTQGVTVQNGYFSVYLGEYDAFPALDWSNDLYLGMTVRGTSSCAWGSCTPADSEMSPRFKLTAVPYAFRAANVASSDTNAASSNTDNVSITTGDALGATSNSGNISIDTGTATGTTGTITVGGANAFSIILGRSGLTTTNAGALTVSQLLTGNLGATISGAAISLNDSSNFNTSINTGTSTGTVSIGSSNAGAITLQSGTSIDIGNNAAAQTITIGNTTGATAITLQAGTGGITFGSGAGQGIFTNNGATFNRTLALGDFAAGGSVGSAATTVDIYTSISIAQTTAGQTLTFPTPTSSTDYGRTVFVSNVGTSSFTLLGVVINPGVSSTLIWSNTNGGAAWQYAGADAGGIQNQNVADQTANFRISGTGRANTSFLTPTLDVATAGTLRIGNTTATAITLGKTGITTTLNGEFAGGTNADISGFGLTDCDNGADVLQYDSTTKEFKCGKSELYAIKTANEVVNNSTTQQDDDHLVLSLGTNQTWILRYQLLTKNDDKNARLDFSITAPTGSACTYAFGAVDKALVNISNTCGATVASDSEDSPADIVIGHAVITTSTTSGNATLRWAQGVATNANSTMYAGSTVTGFKAAGADLAEIYAATDDAWVADVVSFDPDVPAGVKKSTAPYSSNIAGVISTEPGQILGNNDTNGKGNPVPLALVGRIPVKVTNENGVVEAGDMLTASATRPGYAMKATRPGYVIGQALSDAYDQADDIIMLYVNTHYYVPDGYNLLQMFDYIGQITDETATLRDEIRLQNVKLNDLEALFTGSYINSSTGIKLQGSLEASSIDVNTLVTDTLIVNDTASISKLIVVEEAIIQGKLVVEGMLTANNINVLGAITFVGDKPEVVVAENLGVGASAEIIGTSAAGLIKFTTGFNSSDGKLIIIKFSEELLNNPVASITSGNSEASKLSVYRDIDRSRLIIYSSEGLKDNTVYEFDYIINQTTYR